MTKETKIQLLLDEYDEKKKRIEEKYKKKFEDLKVNEAGEVSKKDLLELGAWNVQKISGLRYWLLCELEKVN